MAGEEMQVWPMQTCGRYYEHSLSILSAINFTKWLRKYYEQYEMLLAVAILRKATPGFGYATSKYIQWKLLQYFSTETVLHQHLLS